MRKLAKGLGSDAPEGIDARLDEMDRKLERLRGLYETFFLGAERMPPHVPRRELNRLILEMQQVPINNASLRFRFQSLLQKWVLLTTYWNRTLREIEAGTYQRDLAKAHRHIAARGGTITEGEALRLGIPVSRVKAFVGRQQRVAGKGPGGGVDEKTPAPAPVAPPATPAPLASPAVPRPAAGAAPVPGLSPGHLEAFYKSYLDAHVRSGVAPPKVSLDQLRAKLSKEIPRILSEKGCSRVELDVAVEGGKVRMRARPVK